MKIKGSAFCEGGADETGKRGSKKEVDNINIIFDDIEPKWNYELRAAREAQLIFASLHIANPSKFW